uniref:Endoribonuclease n=1 Tax=Rhabditophanes sp. KR3021 TaxID=114890 RepID=A0AC35U5D9_9BILA
MNNAIAVNGYTAILGTAISEILHDGHFAIGKLKYHNKDVLGEGCHGTIVFQGEFDGRRVAIKKVFSRMVDIVDREINILRDSDSHANVIRYFCSESNADFTFIALELCDFSLGQFIRNRDRFPEVNIEDLDILKQSALGVAHLHSLKIVHRDLKPENILIAKNTATGITRVLISDFGLCKRLKQDSQSISRVSGAVGTEGWKAPEMEMKNGSVTVAVDIFALGCIYYFVLSKGRHPFGEGNVRQNNIMKKSKGDLSLIKDNELSVHLIESMIQYTPSFRPSAKSCLAHPLFWSNDKQLQFFLIVSDRIEKEEEDSEIRKILEYGAQSVINKNWNKYICKDLEEDLRKYRAYRHDQVRDLLRAIRNKKNHYRELPDALRQSLGDIPDHFLNYFTSRFPKLMLHVYKSMNYCAKESIFQRYYKESHAAFFKQPFDSMFSIDEEYEDSKFEGAILLPGVSYAAIMKNAPKQFSPHNVNTNHQDPNFTNVVKKDVRHRRRPANRGQDKKS